VKPLQTIALTACALAVLATSAGASSPPFTANPSPLSQGSPASITVDNTIPTWKTLIVMPGADFTPTNGACHTNLRYSAGYLPRNVWACTNFTAPIVFTTAAVTTSDLTPDTTRSMLGTGYVGFVGTGGMTHGVWTLSSPPSEFDYQPATTL
jgi:hypothetical protein